MHVEADDDAASVTIEAPESVQEGDLVTLSGSGQDAEGQELSFEWVQTGGPTVELDDASSASPSFVAPEGVEDADVTFELRVSDGTNTTAESVTVHVEADNDAPTVTVDASSDNVRSGDSVQLFGSGSDLEGEDLTYRWVQVDGPPVALSDAGAPSPTFVAPDTERVTAVTFELQISDGENTRTETVTIVVQPAPAPGDFGPAPETSEPAAEQQPQWEPPAVEPEPAEAAASAASTEPASEEPRTDRGVATRDLGLSPLPSSEIDLDGLPSLLPSQSFEEVFDEVPLDEEELTGGALGLNLAGEEPIAARETAEEPAAPHPAARRGLSGAWAALWGFLRAGTDRGSDAEGRSEAGARRRP